MQITTIGIDIVKRNFQIHGVNKNGKMVLKKSLVRDQFLNFMTNLPKCFIGMGACGGANHWGLVLRDIYNYLTDSNFLIYRSQV